MPDLSGHPAAPKAHNRKIGRHGQRSRFTLTVANIRRFGVLASRSLTWAQLSQITTAALTAQGCAGWPVGIHNSGLDPDRRGAGNIITYLTHAITSPGRR